MMLIIKAKVFYVLYFSLLKVDDTQLLLFFIYILNVCKVFCVVF